MLGTLITPRTALQENMIVACSRQLIVTRSSDLVVRCLIVLCLMAGGYGTQYQNLSSGKHDPYPVMHASLVNL